MPNIAIVWDFDGTLTPHDSTSLVVNRIDPPNVGVDQNTPKSQAFWQYIHAVRGDREVAKTGDNLTWVHTLASDAPIWMYSLSQLASNAGIGLDANYFKTIVDDVKQGLYNGVEEFLISLKNLDDEEPFRKVNLTVNHFIVSAGLHDLIRLVFDDRVVRWVWGCQYAVVTVENDINDPSLPENIPKYCMDETAKTRALFEISKGTFEAPYTKQVNRLLSEDELFCPFENIIYIGDGFSDVPALSLVRSKGGLGIVVFDSKLLKDGKSLFDKIGQLKTDRRADLITEADFSTEGTLYKAIKAKCIQIVQRYQACAQA